MKFNLNIKKLLTVLIILVSFLSTAFAQTYYDPVQIKISLKRKLINRYLQTDLLDSIKLIEPITENKYSAINILEEERLLLITDKYVELIKKINKNEYISSWLRVFRYDSNS